MTNSGCHIEKVAIHYLCCRPWLSCFGHNLNLTVSKTIDKTEVSMDRALAVCRTITSMFSLSWRRELQNIHFELHGTTALDGGFIKRLYSILYGENSKILIKLNFKNSPHSTLQLPGAPSRKQ